MFFGVYGNSIYHQTDGKCKPTYAQIFAAGVMAGTVQLAVACPVDVVKVVLQSQIPAGKQKGKNYDYDDQENFIHTIILRSE